MMLDKENLVSDEQTVAIAQGTALSTYSIDCGADSTIPQGGTALRDIGRGAPIELLVQVVTDLDSSGDNTTLKVELVQADDAALTSNLEVLADSGIIAQATCVAGYQFRIGSLPGGITKRSVGLRYTIGTATCTAGEVSAGLAANRQSTSV
jgi:hypothetical protein